MVGVAFFLAGCSSERALAPPRAATPAAPVSVTSVVSKSLPVEILAAGNVEAYSTVSVKAQIGGQLQLVEFQEGADVKKGDRLFVIDPRPYGLQVRQAEANLAKDRAQLQAYEANLGRDRAQEEFARSQAARYAELVQRGVVPRESGEQMNTQAAAAREAIRADEAAVESARASVAAEQATLERAKLDLEYCTIFSPIDGRTGRLSVKQGNVVKANDVELVSINQLRPIYVTFAVREADLRLIKKHMAAGKVAVAATPDVDNAAEERGTLVFVENSVDITTGTIRLKAVFDNPGASLWPGEFVRVVLRLNESGESMVVPVTAIQTGQDGKFVYVVKSDMTVEVRPVATSRTVGKEVIVEQGLKNGETVVTEGQLRLTSGGRVEVK